jgi:hypothetical protein
MVCPRVVVEDEFSQVMFGDYRRHIWQCMDDPTSSSVAKCLAAISMAFILISVSGKGGE